MDGKTVAKIISTEIVKRGIPKSRFYEESGISSATLSQWRTGKYSPTPEKIEQVENYLGISLSDYEEETVREELREDLRTLLKAAKGLPPSSVYRLISEIEREKESNGSY